MSDPAELERAALAEAAALDEGAAEPEGFTVGEKIGTLLDAILEGPVPDDAGAATAYRAIRMIKRFPIAGRLTGYFPPLEDEEAWHGLIALLVGCLLNLPSDGAEIDLDAAAALGAETLGRLLEAA